MKNHKSQVNIRPVKMKLGAWVEMTYDAKLRCSGLIWYRVKDGMDNKGDREDWVADIPGICLSVHDYNWDKKKFWTESLFYGSFDKAIKIEIQRALDNARSKRDELAERLDEIAKSLSVLQNVCDTVKHPLTPKRELWENRQ